MDKNMTLLEDLVGEKIYKHSLRVMEEARILAEKFGGDVEKAKLAALYHDCAKGEKNIHPLDHGPLGAKYAKEYFKVDDEEVLNAISFHTTGRKDMGLLDKIVYLADMIEPARDFPGLDKIRDMARVDLDKALLMALNSCIKYIIDKNEILDLNSVEARNCLLKKERNRR